MDYGNSIYNFVMTTYCERKKKKSKINKSINIKTFSKENYFNHQNKT